MKKLFLQLALLFLHAQLFSATFHAVIVADTESRDVRRSASVDIKTMRQALRNVAKASGLKLALTVLSEHKVTEQSLKNWIARKRVHKHDMLFFYFTGHGFASITHKTVWPDLFFKHKKETMAMESIHQALKRKRARLTILLADSCNRYNTYQPFGRGVVEKSPRKVASFQAKKSGLKKLFRKKRGRILASGAVRGTSSYGSDYGGFFTQAFLIALQHESHNAKPSWNRLFNKVNRLLKNAQKPQYKLFLK